MLRSLKSYSDKSAVVLASPCSKISSDRSIVYHDTKMSIPYHETTKLMLPFDSNTVAKSYAACSGCYYIRSLEDITLFTRPTSMLSLLNRVVLRHPNSVMVDLHCPDSLLHCRISLSVDASLSLDTTNHAKLVALVDGLVHNTVDGSSNSTSCSSATPNSVTCFKVIPNSVIRYCYGM